MKKNQDDLNQTSLAFVEEGSSAAEQTVQDMPENCRNCYWRYETRKGISRCMIHKALKCACADKSDRMPHK